MNCTAPLPCAGPQQHMGSGGSSHPSGLGNGSAPVLEWEDITGLGMPDYRMAGPAPVRRRPFHCSGRRPHPGPHPFPVGCDPCGGSGGSAPASPEEPLGAPDGGKRRLGFRDPDRGFGQAPAALTPDQGAREFFPAPARTGDFAGQLRPCASASLMLGGSAFSSAASARVKPLPA